MRSSLFRAAGWFTVLAFAFLALYVRKLGWITSLAIIFAVGTALFLFPFVLLPIRLHGRHHINLQSKHEPIYPGGDIIPQEFWDLVTETVAELDPFGFRLRGHFHMGKHVSNVVVYVSLFENAAQSDVATLVAAFAQNKLASRTNCYL